MILFRLKNGWPDVAVDAGFPSTVDVPDGFAAFESIVALDDWKKSHPELAPRTILDVAPENVPTVVPLWAFRAILTLRGIDTKVDGLIEQLAEPDRTVARIQWVYGNFIVRDHPLIIACGAKLKMSETDIDTIFVAANGLD